MKLQCMFGLIPNVKGKGECAQQVKDMMLRMRREMGGDEPTLAPEIDTLILIDRQVDMVSPMATQLTYEGLIDEVFGISNGFVYLDPDFLPQPGSNQSSAAEHKQQQQQQQKKKSTAKVPTPLNSNDEVYNQIRDQNFSVVGPRLNAKAREIKAYYEVCVLCVCVCVMRGMLFFVCNPLSFLLISWCVCMCVCVCVFMHVKLHLHFLQSNRKKRM
jgi:vacuolar protein sorting-associated protein 33A